MNGKCYKELNKRNHYSKEEKREHRDGYGRGEMVRARQVRKLVRKLHSAFTKASWYDGDGCVFWYDVNDGIGYQECCGLLGGRCDNEGKCPYELVEKLYKMFYNPVELKQLDHS